LNWNISDSPICATQRHGAAERPIAAHVQLEQCATIPPVKSLEITFSGFAALCLEQWDTIHVERRDEYPLRVGDLLNAIHVHLARPLTWDEITTMSVDKWDRITQTFSRRVHDAPSSQEGNELVLQRFDFLDGHTLFDGVQFSGGEFRLSLV
ncbi:hypothetical protein B0H11DRAFT_1711044, partial [Mycena galericulata]